MTWCQYHFVLWKCAWRLMAATVTGNDVALGNTVADINAAHEAQEGKEPR